MITEKASKQIAPAIPKNLSFVKPTSSIDFSDAFIAFKNPDLSSAKVITLIKPPIIFSKNSYSTPLTMPIGTAYLAAALSKADYSVKMLDCPGLAFNNVYLTEDKRFKVQGLSEEESIQRIDPESDIIGVSIMFSQEWPHVREFINKIRKAFPKAIIIAGGEHPTAMPEYTLSDCPAIDYLISGEGELTLLELVYQLRSGKNPHEIKGVSYRENGTFFTQHLSPRMAEIQNMPWPAWHMIDVEAYFQPNFTMGIGHGRNMAMLATRGCPYQCTFCSNPIMWTTRYVMRPVKEVVDEIEYNIRQYQANSIEFYDLTAIVKREWILEFISELERRNVKIIWQLPSGTRSESLDEEVLAGLARVGCGFLVYAPESGSQRTLDMIKKRVRLKNLEKSISTALRYGIVVKVNFIMGFPFEYRRDIFKTLLFIWKLALLKVHDCNVSGFAPYPGSELFDELEKEKRFGQIGDQYFEDLMTQFDFTVTRSYCRYVGPFEIFLYRTLGMSIFYILSYLRVPSRLLRLVKCIFKKGSFKPRSLFEQRIYDFVTRIKQTVAFDHASTHDRINSNIKI